MKDIYVSSEPPAADKEDSYVSSVRDLDKLTKKAKESPGKIKHKHKISKSKLFTLASLLVLILFVIVIIFSENQQRIRSEKIASYEECVASSGSVIREIYPEECVAANGEVFVRALTSDEQPPTVTPSVDESFCGGFANHPCPDGFTCVITAKRPDASGICVETE